MMRILEHADELPPEWDGLAGDNIYLKRDFLSFMERVDACGQKYYLFFDGDRLDTIFMTYRRKKYNLLTFTRAKVSLSMTFVYVPLSVTRPGYVFGKLREEALDCIRGIKGFVMILNAEGEAPGDFAVGMTCPKCILDLRFSDFSDYLDSLRSHYRNRNKRMLRNSSGLRMRWLKDGSEFDDRLYKLYCDVYNGSSIRIEKLPKAFFQGNFFKIFVLEIDGEPLGFVQLLENGEELIFEFVGIEYDGNEIFSTYHRMLLEIVRYGIEHGFARIDFGQTADDTKLKLGCRYVYLDAWLRHSNPIVLWFCKKLARRIEYRPIETPFRVFRGEESGPDHAERGDRQ